MRTVGNRTLALAVVLFGMAALAEPALAAKAAKLTGYDTIVPTGGQTTLRFKVERDNLIRWDLKGVTVEFRQGGTLIGTAVSARDGYADLVVQAGQTAGDVIITGRIAPGGTYRAPHDGTLLLSICDPAATRVVITDIDQTISAGSTLDVLFKSNPNLPPVKGAVNGLIDISQDAVIVYVTARDDMKSASTKSWLSYWGFPRGVVVFSDDVSVILSARAYKSAAIRFLHAMFPDMPCGFGDKVTDAEAYHDNSLTTFIFDTHHAGPFPSYAIVTRDWDDLRAACAAGRRPELGWARSFK